MLLSKKNEMTTITIEHKS